jgi:hypothetical protein
MEIVLLAGLALTVLTLTAKKTEKVPVLVPVRAKREASKNR